MQESEIEKYLCNCVKKAGGIAYKFTSPARRGVPDRLVVMPGGLVYFVEVKCETGKLSELQKVEINRLTVLGQRVFIVWCKEDVNFIMESIDEQH